MVETVKMLKKYLKKIIIILFGKKIDCFQFDKDISYVSFDFFDTLILRAVGTEIEVFEQAARQYNETPNVQKKINKDIRIKAEQDARNSHKKGDVSLEEIYSFISKRYDADKLRECEMDIELETCYANKEIMEVYNTTIAKGKEVVIVSDTYYSKDFLIKVLNKCDITGYSRVYASSEIGLNKRSGKLFNYILKDMNIDKNRIIHIGDNPVTDYVCPKMRGISAFLYRRSNEEGKQQ